MPKKASPTPAEFAGQALLRRGKKETSRQSAFVDLKQIQNYFVELRF